MGVQIFEAGDHNSVNWSSPAPRAMKICPLGSVTVVLYQRLRLVSPLAVQVLVEGLNRLVK